MADENFYKLYNELVEICNEIRPYYEIDKIKSWAVFIYDYDDEKNSESGNGLFDILPDELIWYVDDHTIIEEAKPIIEKIQNKLKELNVDNKWMKSN